MLIPDESGCDTIETVVENTTDFATGCEKEANWTT